ncbi:copper resistance protein CopC [Mycobacterium cookii]|uniref:Copper resistance protein CopC n=1 Tax=Nocardioides furvisabuli TaxID=375542 RepID=A0ABP5JD92_9ACTN
MLETAPEQVTFTFDETVIGVPAGIRVFDATGTEVASSASVRDAELVVALEEEVGDGTLVVLWRLVSADGHPIGGSLSYSVGAPSDVVDVPTADADADTEAPLLLGVSRWLGYLGLLVGAGVALFSVLFLPLSAPADGVRVRLRRKVGPAVVVAVVGWWAAVPLVALYQLGVGASALGDQATWSALAAEEYAVPLAVTLGLGLAVLALLVRAPDRRRAGLVLLGCTVALVAPSLTGHTRAAGPQALVIGVDVLHLVAGALWLGGLVAVGLVLGDLAARDDSGAVVLARFSTWAAGSLAVLVVAGTFLAWRIAGSWGALLDTGYGALLLVKVLLVALAVAIAAWNRFSVLPRLRAAARREERRDAAAVLVRTTLAEAGVLVAVLLVTGFLVDRSPGPDTSTGTPVAVEQSGSEVVRLDDISAEVVLDPLGIGPATLTLTMTDPAGEPAEGFEAPRVSLSTEETDLGEVALTNQGPGVYSGEVVLPTGGDWKVQVSLRTTEFDNPVRSVVLEVPAGRA